MIEAALRLSDRRATVVALVGVDGSGKSTLLDGLRAHLEQLGVPASVLKTESGRSGLDRLAAGAGHADLGAMVGPDTASLMEAAIGWRSLREAKPLLRAPRSVVLCDRHAACHVALAALRSPAVLDEVRTLFSPFRPPDVTLFVTVTPEVASARLSRRGGTPHSRAFLDAFQASYRSVLADAPGRVVELDGDGPPAAVLAAATAALGLPRGPSGGSGRGPAAGVPHPAG